MRISDWSSDVCSSDLDAPSGFRAISREAAMRLNVFNPYTYTLETIIQAGLSNMRVMSVDVRTNEDLRPSRLVKSISSYVRRSLVTIFRVFVRSEEHTSELQSLMRISYAVFCLKKKTKTKSYRCKNAVTL